MLSVAVTMHNASAFAPVPTGAVVGRPASPTLRLLAVGNSVLSAVVSGIGHRSPIGTASSFDDSAIGMLLHAVRDTATSVSLFPPGRTSPPMALFSRSLTIPNIAMPFSIDLGGPLFVAVDVCEDVGAAGRGGAGCATAAFVYLVVTDDLTLLAHHLQGDIRWLFSDTNVV